MSIVLDRTRELMVDVTANGISEMKTNGTVSVEKSINPLLPEIGMIGSV